MGTVAVAGTAYTQISTCDTTTAGGAWSGTTPTADTGAFKEGAGSLSFIVKTSGNNDMIFTPTTPVNLLNKHLRFWIISTHGALLNTYAAGGIQIGLTGDSGTHQGFWLISGKSGTYPYPGGWYNCVLDTSLAADSGTKPTDMTSISVITIRINLTGAGKNSANTWIDNICVCDGLTVYGDNGGAYMDFDTINTKEETAVGGGWGVLRKIGGQYFLTGGLTFGDTAGTATKFQAKSQIAVFENRKVASTLYGITVVDSGGGASTTEFILGSKAGTAGIEGCVIRVQDSTQTPKFKIDGGTDADVDNFKLYGTTFFDASTFKFPANSANVEVLNCNFETSDEVLATTCVIKNCNFISANDEGVALISGNTHNITYSNFMNCPYGIRIPTAGTYSFNGLKFINNTKDIDNTSGGTVHLDCSNLADPTTYTGTVEIDNPVVLTLTSIASGSEVRIYTHGTTTELDGIENTATADPNDAAKTIFIYNYTYAASTYVDIAIHKADKIYYRIENYNLGTSNASLPISQQTDRQYSNP